jgi:hypothetical protein
VRREENLASVVEYVESLRELAAAGDGPRLKAAAMSAARALQ